MSAAAPGAGGKYPKIQSIFYTSPRRKTSEWLMVTATGPQQYEIYCCCGKWGPGCPHADWALGQMKPWYRSRCRLSTPRASTAGGAE